MIAFNYGVLLISQGSLRHSQRSGKWIETEDKGYHKHKVAKTLLPALHLGFNSHTCRLIHFRSISEQKTVLR